MHKVVTSEKEIAGDLNRVGCDAVSFGKVQGGFGIEHVNDGGVGLIERACGKGLQLINTCFEKKKS